MADLTGTYFVNGDPFNIIHLGVIEPPLLAAAKTLTELLVQLSMTPDCIVRVQSPPAYGDWNGIGAVIGRTYVGFYYQHRGYLEGVTGVHHGTLTWDGDTPVFDLIGYNLMKKGSIDSNLQLVTFPVRWVKASIKGESENEC